MRMRTAAAAFMILAVGAWLRLHDLGMMEFKGDERTALELAIQFLDDRPWSTSTPWPSQGLMSSNGVGNSPLFTWIVAPLWALTHHPIGVTAIIAVINVFSLLSLWLWAARRMDEHHALLVLAIAAVSPFAVLFSRKIWPVDLLLPGILAVMWSIEWWRAGQFWRALALAGLGVLLMTHLHQSGVITGPALLLAFAIQWAIDARRGLARRPARPTGAEIAAVAVVVAANLFFWWTYLPYLKTVPASVFAARPRTPSFAPQLLFNVIAEIVPLHVQIPFYDERMLFMEDPVRQAVYYVSLFLGAPLAAYGLWRWLRAPFTLPVAGIWWWMVIASFALARIPSHHYYVLVVMPLPMLLAAGAFDGPLPRAWSHALAAWRWVYVASLLALTIVAGSWLAGRGGAHDDYGVTFEIQQAQARRLLALVGGRAIEVSADLGEAREDQRSKLECRRPPEEIFWIARWMEPMGQKAADDLQRLQLCDKWMADNGETRYRWSTNPPASSVSAQP